MNGEAGNPTRDFSVDRQEVARFDALAERWWDSSGPFWPLHGLNRYRTAYLRELLPSLLQPSSESTARPLDGCSVLDVGCGGGLLSEAIARLGARVHGIDATARNIAIAERHRDASDSADVRTIRYEATTVEALAEREAPRYDLVLNMEVVEHVREPQRFITLCGSLVRPGGAMVVATINRTPKSFVVAILGAEYVLRLLPRGTHRYTWLVKPAEVRAALDDAEFEEVAATGVFVNPFARTFKSVGSLAVNYMLTFRRHAAAALQ